MITLRKSQERGHADHGWLNSYHTFSFAGYHDPRHMGFRSLRVINEDRVAPGQGFGEHPHRDMEIVSYVLAGALQHRDSLGNGSVLRPGEFQRITAGTGLRHSEFNPSRSEPVHFYQIWLLPTAEGLPPGYEQKSFSSDQKRNQFRLVASPTGHDGSLTIQADASIFLSDLAEGASASYRLSPGRHAWLQVLRGAVDLDGTRLDQGDAAAISQQDGLAVTAKQPAEIMLFDLG
jgi:quercetin 2,3-dioxygenase